MVIDSLPHDGVEVHGFVAAGLASFLPWPLVREGRQQLLVIMMPAGILLLDIAGTVGEP